MTHSPFTVHGPGARVVAYFAWINGRVTLLSLVVVRENVVMRQTFLVDKKNT